MQFHSRCLSAIFLPFALAILILPITKIVRSDSARQPVVQPTESASHPRVDYTDDVDRPFCSPKALPPKEVTA